MGPQDEVTGMNIGAYAREHATINVGRDAVGSVTNATGPGSRPRPRPRPRADIGVLTVLTEEHQAVVSVLEEYPNYRSEPLVNGSEAHHADVPAGNGVLRVVAVQTLAPGPRSAAVAFDRLQDAFNPPVVLLVGIAGAIRADLAVGDVVIGEEVIYYDARRETPYGPARRGQTQPMAPVLLHRLNEFSRRYGKSIPEPPENPVRLYRGPIGSGDAVITDEGSDIVDFLRRFNEKTLAVETEAGGVGQAFYERIDEERSLRGWLTIRGISDLADRHKGHDRHLFAAERAALVMDRLLPLLKLPETP
jgi:adenosylhomocysteine nucleosidase